MGHEVEVAMQDLEQAIARYRRLWFWQRWFKVLECECATHAVRLALKKVEDVSYMATSDQFWGRLEPLVAAGHDILGE